jgi:LPS O-antigen subunit length determinant protein (WzzB/FepE family)
VKAIISTRELDLGALKAALDRIKSMSESANHATNYRGRIAAQDATYAKAKADLNKLIQDRDALELEISGNGSMTAVMPDVITARIVELADPPVKPESPDQRIALGAFITGGVVTGAGLFLLVLLNIKPRGAEKKAA